jgi:hypothetical protein
MNQWLKFIILAQTYNPSYSGGKNQDGGGSRPAQENNYEKPSLKNIQRKKEWIFFGRMFKR